MSADLTTTLAGVKFLSPIGVASHAPKQPFTIESLERTWR
jgi:dihydroorotate dehydrogenase